MGAIYIDYRSANRRISQAADVLTRQGFHTPTKLETESHTVLVYPRQQSRAAAVAKASNGDWAAAAGTFLYGGYRDEAALTRLLAKFRGDPAVLNDAIGHFVIVLCIGRQLTLITDRLSALPVYQSQIDGAISTSFLALAHNAPKLTLGKQAVYEFVLTGAPTGDDTLVHEIRRLPWGSQLTIRDGRLVATTRAVAPPEPSDKPRADLLAVSEANLDHYVASVSDIFGDRIAMGVTAGYDSRLLFSLLRRRGATPRAMVYGNGTTDARIAHLLTQVERVPLDVIDVTEPMLTPDTFASVVIDALYTSDGYENEGVFNNNRQHDGRGTRTANDTVYLHGAGGEIFRNFALLPDRPVGVSDFTRSVYGKFDHRVTNPAHFNLGRFFQGITNKVFEFLGNHSRRPQRQTIEWLYPHFRGRAWMGRDNGLNTWVGASLQPFYDISVMEPATAIPVAFKTAGTFEADLIARIRPRLASVPSQYGHSFLGRPPLKVRLIEALKTQSPTRLRPTLYALRERRSGGSANAGYLAQAYVAAALPDGAPRVGPLFQANLMRDPLQRSRMLTVELLARTLPADVAVDWE